MRAGGGGESGVHQIRRARQQDVKTGISGATKVIDIRRQFQVRKHRSFKACENRHRHEQEEKEVRVAFVAQDYPPPQQG